MSMDTSDHLPHSGLSRCAFVDFAGIECCCDALVFRHAALDDHPDHGNIDQQLPADRRSALRAGWPDHGTGRIVRTHLQCGRSDGWTSAGRAWPREYRIKASSSAASPDHPSRISPALAPSTSGR